jgi:hypothetical protein
VGQLALAQVDFASHAVAVISRVSSLLVSASSHGDVFISDRTKRPATDAAEQPFDSESHPFGPAAT